jgi:hypothetical protein
MPHLPHAHCETSKHDSQNETKIKQKQNKTIPDSNLNITKSMTHHNQTKELTTWFLNHKGTPGHKVITMLPQRLDQYHPILTQTI